MISVVTDIVDAETEISIETIKALETALEMARNGELTEVIVCGLRPNGAAYTAWSSSTDPTRRLGYLRLAEHTLIHQGMSFEDTTDGA